MLNKLATLTDEEKGRGVISISAGNHAQALAYASALEGIDALVVMWKTASPMKIAAARGYGATIDTEAADIPAAFDRLEELIESTGRTLVHPYDDPLVMAGQGTVGLEMLEDAPEAEVVLVQVGGGDLRASRHRNGRPGDEARRPRDCDRAGTFTRAAREPQGR